MFLLSEFEESDDKAQNAGDDDGDDTEFKDSGDEAGADDSGETQLVFLVGGHRVRFRLAVMFEFDLALTLFDVDFSFLHE